MSSQTAVDTKQVIQQERIIGSVQGENRGPTIIFLAGMHGNEPAGVEALSNVLNMLQSKKRVFKGRAVGIRGNLAALRRGVRFIDEDMNRLWFPSIVEQIRESAEHELDSRERVEIKRLLPLIDEIFLKSVEMNSPVLLVDLHTFSAEGWMFMLTSPRQELVDLLSQLYVPLVFGIEETLKGTVLEYYRKRGLPAVCLEGGQHNDRITPYNITASILLLLKATGCISGEEMPSVREYESHLHNHTSNLPEKTQLVYQHIIEPGDEFEMRPGFKNFQPVKKGEWLATDREGKIYAESDGYLLMPLYQKQGDDGFFIISEHDS